MDIGDIRGVYGVMGPPIVDCTNHSVVPVDMIVMSKAVALSATRALGLIIAKCKTHGGVPHKVFSQLYDAMVQPIIDYGAAVWGVNEYSHIKTIQHRAGRYFLGLGRYARLWRCVFMATFVYNVRAQTEC